LNDFYYSVTSRGSLLTQKKEEEAEAKLNSLLAKMKPKPWERRFDIVRFVAERESLSIFNQKNSGRALEKLLFPGLSLKEQENSTMPKRISLLDT
jgi:hypothetical protein